MRIYISGTVTGTTDYIARFRAAEEKLRAEGHEVINPMDVNAKLPESTNWDTYMQVSLALLRSADGIYMLKGWKISNGAQCEHYYAKGCGKPVFYEKKEYGIEEDDGK